MSTTKMEENSPGHPLVQPSPPDGTILLNRMVNVFKRIPASTSPVEVVVVREGFKLALDGFEESARIADTMLSSISEIHPFIKPAVAAFRGVLNLELKRRHNNAKVNWLKVEMVDMMSGFFQLLNISKEQDLEANPQMINLITEIVDEIRAAFNLCDYYTKKNVIVQCLQSPLYETRFAERAERFQDIGVRLQRSLTIHTTVMISRMEDRLDGIQGGVNAIYQALETQRERDIRAIIKEFGGAEACVESDAALDRLLSKAGDGITALNASGTDSTQKSRQIKLDLLRDLQQNIDKALQDNLKVYQKKLDFQLREIDRFIKREGDRIITELSGAHERIVDEGWKMSVKARNFVVREYYISGLHLNLERKTEEQVVQTSPGPNLQVPDVIDTESNITNVLPAVSHINDVWAYEYINVSYLQPISEAIDDDGSGLITINEINDFTRSCPKNWSLLQWLAYWAAGWHSSINRYIQKIYRILKKLHELRDKKVLQENLAIVDDYLFWAFIRVKQLLESTSKAVPYICPELAALRDEFCDEEESRLEASLENVSYNLDSPATVTPVKNP
ncbi:hypothetical protein H0H92_008223, partial [Tricholoma furcatifolium]